MYYLKIIDKYEFSLLFTFHRYCLYYKIPNYRLIMTTHRYSFDKYTVITTI